MRSNQVERFDLLSVFQYLLLTHNVCAFSKQSSGAKVADRVKDLYNEMKLAKNDPGRLRFVTLGFCDNCIDVTASTQDKDLEGKDPFVFFMDLLVPDECRYILYDCHYETVDSVKKEIVSVMW